MKASHKCTATYFLSAFAQAIKKVFTIRTILVWCQMQIVSKTLLFISGPGTPLKNCIYLQCFVKHARNRYRKQGRFLHVSSINHFQF